MKKSEIVDVTIRPGARARHERMVGDVSTIGTGDTAKAGVSGPSGTEVGAPETSGNPSGAPSGPTPMTIPSVGGLPTGYSKGPSPELAPANPGAAPEAGSVQTSPNGQGVSWPAASDGASAGGAKSVSDFVQVTGSKVAFPAGANTSAPIKDVKSFG